MSLQQTRLDGSEPAEVPTDDKKPLSEIEDPEKRRLERMKRNAADPENSLVGRGRCT